MKEKIARILAPSVFKAYDKEIAQKSMDIYVIVNSMGKLNLQIMQLRGELSEARKEIKGLRTHELPRLQEHLRLCRLSKL